MNIGKILLYIFSVLISLAIICLIFPQKGITIGNVTLEFPTLKEAITPAGQAEVQSEQAVEDNVKKQLDALHNAKQKEFDDFCKNSPTRIFLPNNDITYLDPFYEALENAKAKPIRIVHYGDSQLECDRMTSAIRELFQEKFGGSGVGMIPAVQPIETYTLSQTISPTPPRYCAFGSAEFRAGHHRYGPMAAMSRINGSVTLSFSGRGNKKFPHCQYYQKISVVMKGNGTMTVKTDSQTISLQPNYGDENMMRTYSVTLPRPTKKARLNISGNMDVYGIMLDGANGISMDNIPMRGCSGTLFDTLDRSTFAPFFKQQNVGLIILQYGGNSVPGATNTQTIAVYKNQIKEQIRLFRQIAPKARILFIGPADMSARIKGSMQSYPNLEKVITALRQAANEEGAAFWDMYRAQGGHNSMIAWVKARPQLAGEDYVHFTPLGAEKMSQILYDTFQLYYRFYKFRKETPKSEASK